MLWTAEGFSWAPFGLLGMLLMLVGCAVMMRLMCRRHFHMPGARHGQCGGGALEILGERYARGEISQAEFERMRKDLG